MGPSDTAWQQLISALHASGRKAALAITGGGSGAIGELLRVPGGSRLLIEAQVPYDAQALATYLGFAPEQASSANTAIAMARSARARAARLVPAGTDLVGLGATAALVSDRPRRGEHRFHIAAATSAGIEHCTCVMAKGRRDRGAEEISFRARSSCGWPMRAELPHRRRAPCSTRMNNLRRRSSRSSIRSICSWPATSIASPFSPMAR